jgi:hypothetical protein
MADARGGSSLRGSDLGGEGGGASAEAAGAVDGLAGSSAVGVLLADSAGMLGASGVAVVWAVALKASVALKTANTENAINRVITACHSLLGVFQKHTEALVGIG